MPILTRKPNGPYYSRKDEEAFFEWLRKIGCVQRVDGVGAELRIHIRSRRISEECLRELIALFWRYGGPMHQLAQFENARNRSWFRNPSMYWFRSVFGKMVARCAATATHRA